MNTVLWQRIEGLMVLCAALGAVWLWPGEGMQAPWWVLVLLFFAPDLGILGYLAGPRVGAAVYNLAHLYGLGLGLFALGLTLSGGAVLITLGLLWMGHVGFDRMLGYGLKEPTAFADTHLGRIGPSRPV